MTSTTSFNRAVELLEAPLRSLRRRAVRSIPRNRRVNGYGGARGRALLQARKLVSPYLQLPVTLKTRYGLRLRVTADPVDEHIAAYMLGHRRTDYFPAWPAQLPQPALVADIGCHHGLYAAAALHAYPGARAICVEPSADALPLIRKNLAINGLTNEARIVHAGLAPAHGEGVLRHTADGSWGSSLYEDEESSVGTERVPLMTLAEILDGERPDIIKCNAEGAEYSLIEQLEASDVRPALMIVMVHPEFGDLDALVARARSMGYESTAIGTPQRPAFHLWRVTS